jgi:hypothetical protein
LGAVTLAAAALLTHRLLRRRRNRAATLVADLDHAPDDHEPSSNRR